MNKEEVLKEITERLEYYDNEAVDEFNVNYHDFGAEVAKIMDEYKPAESASKVEYRISKISIVWDHGDMAEIDSEYDGRIVTMTNVDNPFDYFTQYVPDEVFSEEEFKIGKIIELED